MEWWNIGILILNPSFHHSIIPTPTLIKEEMFFE